MASSPSFFATFLGGGEIPFYDPEGDYIRLNQSTLGVGGPQDASPGGRVRQHIDATVMAFLQGEKDADWTEVALVTLHPPRRSR